MDEAIRIYQPSPTGRFYSRGNRVEIHLIDDFIGNALPARGKHLKPEEDFSDTVDEDLDKLLVTTPPVRKEPEKDSKVHVDVKESRMTTFMKTIEENEERIRRLNARYPWVPILFNWIIAALIVLLVFSFVRWGIKIRNDNREASIRATAYAEFQAEQTAKEQEAEDAKKKEEASIASQMARDIDLMAMFLDGIKGFVENRGYTDIDVETYGQCPINRVLNTTDAEFKDITTLEEAIMQDSQWVGMSLSNQITIGNKAIAEKLVTRFYNKEPMPCSNSYCWTEFTDRGLWLKSDYGPAAFNNTWRAG